MNRTAFLSTLILVVLMVLAGSLPNSFYKANDRLFVIATIVISAMSLIALVLFFSIR
ncbi:hypothetical protein V2H45_06020 [Tumidithrix elongata RA019]|uniref:Uncharacterized protein n=1 Tax=Tumidithrix elongata BACA0141 TaxID=2716417 RepID=A0AAW9PVI9_9CYAN|nr:hypothetical protein [Tumidithrix elongata RA019]